ncbi:flagellar protein FlaG [Candidatus Magnetomoraceae bacterium gMMP-15]
MEIERIDVLQQQQVNDNLQSKVSKNQAEAVVQNKEGTQDITSNYNKATSVNEDELMKIESIASKQGHGDLTPKEVKNLAHVLEDYVNNAYNANLAFEVSGEKATGNKEGIKVPDIKIDVNMPEIRRNVNMEHYVDKDTKRDTYVITVKERDSGKVVREIPSEEVRQLATKIAEVQELMGMVLDTTV